ncbi:N-acetylneuraminate lyase [Ceratitis capitata]|uniref:N-acetylneuraminate lyase n=1 Tax=Ceratitis capitata TaxID=7213 RepID=UPI00032A0227|nr:N-acetylneuraminate lyase [Ceratitis capitata]
MLKFAASLRRKSTPPIRDLQDDFQGLYAPVFTCFQADDQQTLQLGYINEYAAWLKSNGVKGVLVNGIAGEGPTLGLIERKLNAEAWSRACKRHSLVMMLQIGAAPLPDVLDLARHANELYLQAVVCISEMFYVPSRMKHLVGYCKIVAEKCTNHNFLYYHLPKHIDMKFDMEEFCRDAETEIPTFAGLICSHGDLLSAAKCLGGNRVIFIGDSKMLASGMLLGFEAAIMTVVNIEPALMQEIYQAMMRKDLKTAKTKQSYLNQLIRDHVTKGPSSWVADTKKWFNQKMSTEEGCGVHVGETRRFAIYEYNM